MAVAAHSRVSKAFVVGFAVVFAIGLFLMAVVNYWIDPENVFHRKYTAAGRAGEILASGQKLGMAGNMDDRLVQREYLRHVARLPNAISLGSSRSREISVAVAPAGTSFFNHGVNGASLEDAVAILGLYLQRNRLPDVVIWSVDPWIFNRHFSDQRWQSLPDAYRVGAAKIGLDRKTVESLDRLRSLVLRADLLVRIGPVVDILGSILDGAGLDQQLRQRVQPVEGENWSRLLVYTDGSFRWGASVLRRTIEEVSYLANEAAENSLLSRINNFEQLDEQVLHNFEKIVEFLLANGVRVILFLPPYQPDAYAILKKRSGHEGIMLTEAWLRRLADTHGIALAGSYDAAKAGCGRGDFVDAHHPRRACVNRILAPVTAGREG